MKLTRRQVIAGAASGALGAAGLYELVDRLSDAPERAGAAPWPREQHVLEGLEVVMDDDVEVLVIPRHHQVVTARVNVDGRRDALRRAQRELAEALAGVERRFEPTPAGLGVTVAWGAPYFRRYVPRLAASHVPVDRRASRTKEKPVSVLIDTVRFPSDPPSAVLEENDVAVLLRGDEQEHVAAGARAIFDDLGHLLEPTSIRKGFVGGGLPRQLAVAAGVKGADLVPADAQLFLGFTSTQRASMGRGAIANFETLGFVDVGTHGYFAQGTSMHLSHVFENLEAWYLNFDFRERVDTSFRPGLEVRPEARSVRQEREDAAAIADVRRDFDRIGQIGHSAAIQTSSRLQSDVVGADGVVYRKGAAIPQRADFNTLDNPFFWTSDRERDRWGEEPSPGLHFVSFNPSSDDFHRNRLAMDGVLPDGTKLPFPPRGRGQGFNPVLQTTHRQNFLVPPRRHRSFPLVELLA